MMTRVSSSAAALARGSGPPVEHDLLDRIAHNVEVLRMHSGWSRAEVARRAGLSPSQAKHMAHRRGNPGLAEILGLANAFGVTIGQLTGKNVRELATPGPETERYDLDAFTRSVGTRLRAHRRQKRMSIRELAERSHLSKSTVRSVEMNVHTPAVRTMIRIAGGLGLSLAELVDVLRVPRVSGTSVASSGGVLRTLLRDTGSRDDVHVHELHLSPGQTRVWPMMKSGSTAMTYVLEGTIQIASDGDAFTATVGETAVMAPDRQFSLASAAAEPARCLLIVRTAAPQ